MWTAVTAAAAALALLSSSPASAQFVCTVTPTDSTCTNNGTAVGGIVNTANGVNQNATTTNNGTNTAGNFDSVTTAGGNATAVNNGLNTAGFQAQTNAGGNAVATNNGTNSGMAANTLTTGDATATNNGTNNGILRATANSGNATTVNTGTSTGAVTAQTQNFGNATVVNSGTAAVGIAALTNTNGNATATNSGSVAGSIVAQVAGAGNATVTNSGTNTGNILAQAVGGGSATVTNTGSTLTVSLDASRETLTNSGFIGVFIPGGTGNAIMFGFAPDTLNLLPGSRIVGGIQLGGFSDTVNFLGGNNNLTFNTLAHATVTGLVPFVVSGNRAVSIDSTPFGLADKNLMDFTRGISEILGSLGGAGPTANGPLSSAFAPAEQDSMAARVDDAFASLGNISALGYANNQAMVFKNPTYVAPDGRAVWARGFGGERTQDPDGVLLGAHTSFFGGAVGFDILARPDLRLGLFAGGGESRLSEDFNSGSTTTDTAFGGVYGRWGFVSLGAPSFLDFALHGGGSTNSTSRTLTSNIAPFTQVATASYDSSYISPEIKYGVHLPLWAQWTLTPSIGLRYVAGFFGGYTESGSSANLTVASRTIQDIEERGEVKLTRVTPVGPDLLLTSVHVGAIGVERMGDTTVNTVLLGASLPFVTPGRSSVAGVVGGGGLEWRTREGVSFFGAAEAIGFSDQSTVWSARGGIRVAF